MHDNRSNFFKALNRKQTGKTALYCTGYPELDFINQYLESYYMKDQSEGKFLFNSHNYAYIKQMGFDAVSLWEYRRGEGGYDLPNGLKVDGWGRLYKGKWYRNDGVFKNGQDLQDWGHLTLPSQERMDELSKFLPKLREDLRLIPVLSLPGLFEKTWQSMGLLHFSKCIKNDIQFIRKVIAFFQEHVIELIRTLQQVGADVFIIADDCAYNQKLFIPKETWKNLFFEPYLEIVGLIHENPNIKVILHSDGSITDLIDIFIEIGFDALQSLEPNAGVDIFQLFETYKDKICFIGNVDMSDLVYSSPKKIEACVKKLITSARAHGAPFVLSPTQQINSLVKPKNFHAMIKTVKAMNNR